MATDEHVFLFASLDSKQPLTTRKVHIRRLYDVLQLSIQRQDSIRAQRAWAVLSRCKEIDWRALWSTGLLILAGTSSNGSNGTEVEYLRTVMLQYPEDRESILKELVFRLLLDRKCREALDELELYLPSVPYQDNPVLHIYAGLSCLYLSQSNSKALDRILARDARNHLEHAKVLEPENVVARAFLDKIAILLNEEPAAADDSDDETMAMDDAQPHKKRSRT